MNLVDSHAVTGSMAIEQQDFLDNNPVEMCIKDAGCSRF